MQLIEVHGQALLYVQTRYPHLSSLPISSPKATTTSLIISCISLFFFCMAHFLNTIDWTTDVPSFLNCPVHELGIVSNILELPVITASDVFELARGTFSLIMRSAIMFQSLKRQSCS